MPLSPFKEDYRRSTRAGQNVYALIADPEQYVTPEAYKKLASRQDQASTGEGKPKLFKRATVLSATEAEELYEPLLVALDDCYSYMDKALWKINPELDERAIWSNMTQKEMERTARVMLKQGQVSPMWAAAVRGVVDSSDYFAVMMIHLPRANESWPAIRDRPRSKKKPFSLVRMPHES